MQVAIISDIHNNEVNLKKVLDFCDGKSASRRIKTIICCGDLASQETLDFLNKHFFEKFLYTFGNMDKGQLQDFDFEKKYTNMVVYKKFGEVEIEDRKIAFVHYPNVAKELAETGKYSYVFYGHTHKPWVEKIGNCTVLNPGNVAGEIYPPTFAVWETDTDKFELIRIHSLK